MSRKLVARSPDLKRLQDEGFDLQLVGTHLLVRQVPYVNVSKEVKRGTLVSVLEVHQDSTIKPTDHTAYLIGERPCDASGTELTIIVGDNTQQLAQGVDVNFRFSSKPTHGRGYADYHDKITTYVKILMHEARAIDSTATALVFPTIEPDEDDPVFKYYDSSASRAGIDALSPKLAQSNIAILGLGGTGSYILDLVAKTHVRVIHLFDDDYFHQHNAFRCPGALSLDELKPNMRKVDYYRDLYSKLRHGVVAHPYRITATNVDEPARNGLRLHLPGQRRREGRNHDRTRGSARAVHRRRHGHPQARRGAPWNLAGHHQHPREAGPRPRQRPRVVRTGDGATTNTTATSRWPT